MSMMQLKEVYRYSLVLFLLASLSVVRNQEFIKNAVNLASNILFGDIWRFGEYCGFRDPDDILSFDLEAQSLYNGTGLEALETSKDWKEIKSELNHLIYVGIKSKNSYNLACSVNSWGYEDEISFHQSNQPVNNETECSLMIDELYSQVRLFIDHAQNLDASAADSYKFIFDEKNSSDQRQHSIKSWLQLNNYGRVPSGPLYHAHHWTGNYKGCVRETYMRYCYGAYRMLNWTGSELSEVEAIRVGVCLPRSCDDNSASHTSNLKKVDQLIKYNLIKILGLTDSNNYQLVSVHCPPAKNSAFLSYDKDLLSIVLVILGFLWIAAAIYFTFIGTDESSGKLAKSFDLKIHWVRFANGKASPNDIPGISAMKVIVMVWLMSAHIFIFYTSYISNMQDLRDTWKSSFIGAVLLQAQHGVPLFFIISGLLAGLKKEEPLSRAGKIRAIIRRYIRLLPMYLLVYAYVKKFAHLMGSGPLWDYGTSRQSEMRQCMKESWLVPILMLGNFVYPFSHCILTGWHIANDFQIFLILPLLFEIYQQSRFRGNMISLGLFLLSHLYHVWNFHYAPDFHFQTFSQEPVVFGPRVLLIRLGFDYLNPFGRAGTYLLGVVLGDLLFDDKKVVDQALKVDHAKPLNRVLAPYDSNSKSNTKNNRSVVDYLESLYLRVKDKLVFIVGISLLVPGILSSVAPTSVKEVFGSYSKSVAYPFNRFIVELGWFCLLYTLLSRNRSASTDQKQRQQKQDQLTATVDRFLSSPAWNILVKLNYSLMLTHFTVVRYILGTQSHLLVFNWLNLCQLATFTISLCYLVSVLIHLVIEMPLTSLVKLLPLS